MSHDPRGIVIGDGFADYIDDLRKTWPENEELAAKHGVAAENGHSDITMNSQQPQQSEQLLNKDVGRRTFLAGVAATAATVAVGPAAAQEGQQVPDFSNDYVPDPYLTGTATVEAHKSDWNQLDYQPNSGSKRSLREHGGQLAERVDADTPHNPVRFRADLISTAEYTDFPRGVTRLNADDEEVDVSALDASEWTTTGTEITVEDADDSALRVVTAGLADGVSASATFDNFTIDSGEPRKYLQIVGNVDLLESAATATVTLTDAAANTVTATIDSAAVVDDVHTIATEQGSGIVYQAQLGELDGGTNLDTIESVTIEVSNADLDWTIYGLNLNREDTWSYGQRERLNADDELETITLEEPTGYTGIKSATPLTETFGDATIGDLQYDIWFLASELPNSDIEIEVTEPERSDYDQRFSMVGGFDLPSAYELSIELTDKQDTQLHPSSRYGAAEIETTLSEIPTLDDVEDIEWTDVSTEYSGDVDDEVTLSTAVSASNVIGFRFVIDENSEIISQMVTTASGGAAPLSGNGGIMSSIYGWGAALASGVVVAFAAAKAWAGNAVSG